MRFRSIGLRHSYPVQARTYFITITITVTDTGGAQAVKGAFAIVPLYKVTFGPMEFGPIHDDCDQTIFTGKGDFRISYSYVWDNGSYTVSSGNREVRFDLNVNELYRVFPGGITFHEATQFNYPEVKWDWQELDSFLNPKFDPGLAITGVPPNLGTHTSGWYTWTKSGFTVRYRFTRTTVLEQ